MKFKLTCISDECNEPATSVIITDTEAPVKHLADAYYVTGTCDLHAPETMHEMLNSGVTRDEMVTAAIDPDPAERLAHAVAVEDMAWVGVLPTDVAGTPVHINDRVEVPAYTDDWMRGDRYGTVWGYHNGVLTVKLDKSQQMHTYIARDCRV